MPSSLRDFDECLAAVVPEQEVARRHAFGARYARVQVRVPVAIEVAPAQGPDLRALRRQAKLRTHFDESVRVIPIEVDRAAFEGDRKIQVAVTVEIGKRVRERLRRSEQLRLHRSETGLHRRSHLRRRRRESRSRWRPCP